VFWKLSLDLREIIHAAEAQVNQTAQGDFLEQSGGNSLGASLLGGAAGFVPFSRPFRRGFESCRNVVLPFRAASFKDGGEQFVWFHVLSARQYPFAKCVIVFVKPELALVTAIIAPHEALRPSQSSAASFCVIQGGPACQRSDAITSR